MKQTRLVKDVCVQSVRAMLCVALMAAVPAGCGREEANDPPVATPGFTMSRAQAAIGSPVTLTYRFQVAPGAKIDGDYRVFVHVLTPDGEQMWTDDHYPVKPTSQWTPGETIEYSRTVFVPNYPHVGDAEVRLGLYSDAGRRLALSAQEASRREYVVGRFEVLPVSENILLVDKDGWHPAELAADNPASEWRWTGKRAVTSFKNPGKAATLFLEYDARPDLFTPPQQVTISIGSQVIATFAADSREKKLLTFPVAVEQFGSRELVELEIAVDRTFAPGGGDTRELGIRVFHLFLDAR